MPKESVTMMTKKFKQHRFYRYLYLQVIYNLCYTAALLGLIHFWVGTRDMLKPYKPVWKFVTVKAVVFSTFWQGFFISLLLPQETARSLQTWILCIEMLPAAFAMWFAFPATQYIRAVRSREQGGLMMAVQNVGRVAVFTDVVADLNHQVWKHAVSCLKQNICTRIYRSRSACMWQNTNKSIMQFKPQYNTYTCYKDMEAESQDPQPSAVWRHATYIMKDPYQQHALAESRRAVSAHTEVRCSMLLQISPACQSGASDEC